ncbi:MAG: FAD-dependent oxidoreductase [Dehalococcoidia bacterium]|nr:FAD-dependent oxidoreductase [Dehalococcoidia bacterium]
MEGKILVIGAGIGGLKASLDLAESGFKVYLCDRSPDIGGTLVQLDKWFPDNHCGMCKVLPTFGRDFSSQYCLRKGLIHPNIELLPLTEVMKVEGTAGDFSVSLRNKPSGVRKDLCIGCGLCTQVCPVEVADEFNEGLGKRKAIYVRRPLLGSNNYVIDWDNCSRCEACVKKCPVDAINLSKEDKVRELKVGAVIVSSGFEEFDTTSLAQYGHKRYPNVVTSIELERLLSASGPSQGKLVRPSDGKIPQSIAFLQCVGSRCRERDYCSSACCMYALKEAMMAKEKNPQLDAHIFFMDMRTFGKGYYRYYLEARSKYGVNFSRCRIPVVKGDPRTGDLYFTSEADDGSLQKRQFEMVVLSIGQSPSNQFGELSRVLGIESNKWGFCRTSEFSPTATTKEGIYVCGSASGPKDIADSLIGAGAAACQASKLLSSCRGEVAVSQSYPADTSEEEPRTAIFICRCGEEVGSIVDIDKLVASSRDLTSVVACDEVPYLCRKEALEGLNQKIEEYKADRVVLAGCSLLRGATGEIKTPYVQIVNLREDICWVHKGNKPLATEKAKSMLAMASEKIRLEQAMPLVGSPVNHKALVIGGGLAGLVSAASIVEQGFEVHMVEKSGELGGNLQHIYSTLGGNDPQALLKDLMGKTESNPMLHLYKETEVLGITGYAGGFTVTLKNKDAELSPVEVGAIIIATGGHEYQPNEYSYGQSANVFTQSELEKRLASGDLDPKRLNSVVMIQCVGSMDADRSYCSRICCSQALRNALNLKQKNPGLQISILYREMMSYGFSEEYYTRAREQGVLFSRYEADEKPEVREEGNGLKVQVRDPVLGGQLAFKADLVVLSPAILPEDNKSLAGMLDLELTQDGFFEEAEVKFRPVDFAREGIFACGLALSPRNIGETIAQAQAAAQRAVSLLRREKLESGRIVSAVNARRCAGCEICIQVCPYGARFKDVEKRVVVVREALCQGCGACAAACPSGATTLRGFTSKQALSMTDVAA